jgi:Leucine-rich repeat (LRR) protein
MLVLGMLTLYAMHEEPQPRFLCKNNKSISIPPRLEKECRKLYCIDSNALIRIPCEASIVGILEESFKTIDNFQSFFMEHSEDFLSLIALSHHLRIKKKLLQAMYEGYATSVSYEEFLKQTENKSEPYIQELANFYNNNNNLSSQLYYCREGLCYVGPKKNESQTTINLKEIPEIKNYNKLYLTTFLTDQGYPVVRCNLQGLSIFPSLLDCLHLTDLTLRIQNPEVQKVYALTNLIKLKINDNNIQEIDPSITQLQRLKKLNLNSNNLNDLPENFSTLQNLRTLQLSHNRFARIPDTLYQLTALTRLDFEGKEYNKNQLEVPSTIAQLTNLKKLSLCEQNLSCIPNFLFKLAPLEVLTLHNNHIKNLSSDLTNLPKLRNLGMARNKLENFPDIITQLPSLRYFDISHNPTSHKVPALPPDLPARLTIRQEKRSLFYIKSGKKGTIKSISFMDLPQGEEKDDDDNDNNS